MKQKTIISLIFVICIMFFCLIIYFCCYTDDEARNEKVNTHLTNDSTMINIKSLDQYDNNAKEIFIKILTEDRDSRKPWIERKEISAWAATILFLSIIMIAFKNIDMLKGIPIFIPLILILLFLFGLFIHQQYGGLIDGMAIQNAFNIWIYKSIQENKIPDNFNFSITDRWNLPNSLMESIGIHQKYIRQHKIFCRIFLPYYLVVSKILGLKGSFTTVEIEESILYNILILSTLSLLFGMRKNKLIINNK